MAPDLNLLMLFLQIVNAGSLSRASKALLMPKASLSRKLRQLERQCGALLVQRGPRGLEMTDIGRALYLHCGRIAGLAQDIKQTAVNMQSLMRGRVRVSMPFGLSNSWVSDSMAMFAQRHPEVNLVVHATNRWVDVTDEQYDVVIHIGRAKNLDIPTRRLTELPRGLYASTDYCERRGRPRVPVDLLQHDCIVLESQLADGLWILNGERRTESELKPRVVTTDIILARELALAGLGIAMLTHVICEEEVRQGRLQRVLPNWDVPAVVIAAMFPERRFVPARVRAFVDCMADALKKTPPLRSA
jgi:DNA-binding transcriptional LysR family regulator